MVQWGRHCHAVMRTWVWVLNTQVNAVRTWWPVFVIPGFGGQRKRFLRLAGWLARLTKFISSGSKWPCLRKQRRPTSLPHTKLIHIHTRIFRRYIQLHLSSDTQVYDLKSPIVVDVGWYTSFKLSTGRRNLKFLLGYISSLKPTWEIWDPVSKTKSQPKLKLVFLLLMVLFVLFCFLR